MFRYAVATPFPASILICARFLHQFFARHSLFISLADLAFVMQGIRPLRDQSGGPPRRP